MSNYKRAYASIDLDAIKHNIKELISVTPKKLMYAGVVKLDGYGHGAVPVARAIEPYVSFFCVATVDEAINLKRHHVKKPILILGPIPGDEYEEAVRLDIRFTVFTLEQANLLSVEAKKQNKNALIHIALDTGMNRIGLKPTKEDASLVKKISELEKVKNKIDDRFEKTVNLIYGLKNNKVVVTGIGKSGLIGKKIAATLASTGTSAIFINAAEALHGDLGMISNGDIVITISNSGNSDEILSILTPIKKIGGKIIAFTGNEKSTLAKYAEIVINIGVEKEACPLGTAPMSSTTATLVMGDALAVALMKMRNFTENDFAKYHPGGSLGKRLLLTVSDLMHMGDELPVAGENEEIENILLLLTKKKMGAVCISEDGKAHSRLKGIITEGDIRRALQHKEKFFTYKARDIMISSPVSISKDSMALEALHLMENRKSQINVLPVVEDGNVVGIIRIHDLIGLK